MPSIGADVRRFGDHAADRPDRDVSREIKLRNEAGPGNFTVSWTGTTAGKEATAFNSNVR